MAMSMNDSELPQGIVYILTNEAMPGYVKIGRTDGDLASRVRQPDSTGVPLPFEVFYAARVRDSASLSVSSMRPSEIAVFGPIVSSSLWSSHGCALRSNLHHWARSRQGPTRSRLPMTVGPWRSRSSGDRTSASR